MASLLKSEKYHKQVNQIKNSPIENKSSHVLVFSKIIIYFDVTEFIPQLISALYIVWAINFTIFMHFFFQFFFLIKIIMCHYHCTQEKKPYKN